jgi:hypothetical protein
MSADQENCNAIAVVIVLPLLKNKKCRHYDEEKSYRVVPLDVLLQIPDGKK